MMGTKERNFQPLPEDISLEDLVAEDNFYRRLRRSSISPSSENWLRISTPPVAVRASTPKSSSVCNWSCSMRISVAREN